MTTYEKICFKIVELYRKDSLLQYFKYEGSSVDNESYLCKMYSFKGILILITCYIDAIKDNLKIDILYKNKMFEEDNRDKLSDVDYNYVVDMLTGLLYSIGYDVLENV